MDTVALKRYQFCGLIGRFRRAVRWGETPDSSITLPTYFDVLTVRTFPLVALVNIPTSFFIRLS